jgi:hypothetical protein
VFRKVTGSKGDESKDLRKLQKKELHFFFTQYLYSNQLSSLRYVMYVEHMRKTACIIWAGKLHK